jgi:hypothetical protein
MHVNRQTDLLEIIRALNASRSLTCFLNCGQQKRYENSDNRDHDQQLYQGKG